MNQKLWQENIVIFAPENLTAIHIKNIYQARNMKKKNKKEPKEQSTPNKNELFSYDVEGGNRVTIYEEDLVDGYVDIEMKVDTKVLASNVMSSINCLQQLSEDKKEISEERIAQQIIQYKNALMIMQNLSLEMIKIALEPKAILKPTIITKEK